MKKSTVFLVGYAVLVALAALLYLQFGTTSNSEQHVPDEAPAVSQDDPPSQVERKALQKNAAAKRSPEQKVTKVASKKPAENKVAEPVSPPLEQSAKDPHTAPKLPSEGHEIIVDFGQSPGLGNKVPIELFQDKREKAVKRFLEKDKKGEYRYTLVQSEVLFKQFVISARGFRESKVYQLKDTGSASSHYRITLNRGWALSGHVHDPTGKAIRGARIILRKKYRLVGRQSSDDKGQFHISGLEWGDIDIRVWAKGYVLRRMRVFLREEHSSVDIELKEGATLAGKVLDSSGKAASFADVFLEKRTANGTYDSFFNDEEHQLMSTQQGDFRFADLPDGRYNIRVTTKDRGASIDNAIEIRDAQSLEDIGIVLKVGGKVSGRVVDEAGKGVVGVKVHLMTVSATGESRLSHNMKSKAKGTFAFANVASAKVRFQVQGESIALLNNETYDVGNKNILLKVVTLKPLTGVVTYPDGRPCKDYALLMWNHTGSQKTLRLPGVKRETFSISLDSRDISSNPAFVLIAKSKGYSPGVSRRLNALTYGGGRIVIALKPEIDLRFRVKSAIDHQALVGAIVTVNETVFVEDFPSSETINRADENGLVHVRGLHGGETHFHVQAEGYSPKSLKLILKKADESVREVYLSKGGTIKGWLVNDNQEPIPLAALYLYDLKSREMMFDAEPKVTGQDGSFVIAHVPPGKYGIYVRESSNEISSSSMKILAQVELSEGETKTLELKNLTLHKVGSVRGRFEDVDYAREFQHIALSLIGGEENYHFNDAIMEGGRFDCRKIRAGKYLMSFSHNNGKYLSQKVEVKEGEVTELFIPRSELQMRGRVITSFGVVLDRGIAVLFALKAEETELSRQAYAQSPILNGHFEFRGIEAGRYELLIDPMNASVKREYTFMTHSDDKVVIKEEEVLNYPQVVLQRARRVSGHIVDIEGNRIEGAGFLAVDSKGNWHAADEQSYSDSDGAFVLNACPLDPFTLHVKAKGYAPRSVLVRSEDVGEISIRRGGKIRIQLEGEQVSGRKVWLTYADESPIVQAQSRDEEYQVSGQMSDEVGRLEFKQLSAATYLLRVVNEKNRSIARKSVEIGNEEEKDLIITLNE